MAVFSRRDSPFWWMWLEGTRPQIRTSTGIPIGKGTARKDSLVDADAVYRAAMGDLARGTFKLHKPKASISFRKHAEWYRDHISVHHRGKRREDAIITALIRAFGPLPLTAVTTKRIEEWKTARAAMVKPVSVNREIDVLKPMLARAIPTYLESNPAKPVKKFRTRSGPITILSESAEDALLKVASPAERAMVLLGLDALLRLGDVRTLKAEHDRGAYIDVIDPKTTPYKVPVSTRLRAALDRLTPQGGYYFPRRYAERWAPMSEQTAWLMFKSLCERADVPTGRKAGGITFHGLRHTGATRATRVVKLTVVQRLGGWTSLKQLARYDHPDDAEIVRAVEAIGSRVTHAEKPTQKKRNKSDPK